MAVSAADRMGDLLAQCGKGCFIIIRHGHPVPQTWIVGGLAGIAGSRSLFINPACGTHVSQAIQVTALLVIIYAEGVTGEEGQQARVQFQLGIGFEPPNAVRSLFVSVFNKVVYWLG